MVRGIPVKDQPSHTRVREVNKEKIVMRTGEDTQ